MEDEQWLAHLLEVCRSEREDAAKAPRWDGYVDALDEIIANIERDLTDVQGHFLTRALVPLKPDGPA